MRDNYCFLYAILSCLHPAKDNVEKPYHYKKYLHELNFSGLSFPLKLKDIPKFQKANPSISVNVFGLDDKRNSEIVPLFVTREKRKNHVNLLLISNEKTSHYVWIKNFSALVRHRTSHQGKVFVCDNCIRPYTTKLAYDRHLECCLLNKPAAVKMPVESSDPDCKAKAILKFDSKQKCHPVPFVIYCDFEAFLCPVVDESTTNSTTVRDKHIPSGFAAKTVCIDDSSLDSELFCYSGDDVIEKFIEHLFCERERINNTIIDNVPMEALSPAECTEINNAKYCAVCKLEFADSSEKYRHHNHLTGDFISTVCNACNLQLKPVRFKSTTTEKCKYDYLIPIILHNSKYYDSHLIIEKLHGSMLPEKAEIRVIASNSEQFISFQFCGLRFIDSCLFLSASLETLVENLKKSNGEFKITREYFNTDIMLQKGVYPYENMTDRSKFAETSLPPKTAFYSKLTESDISDADYEFAQKIFKDFGCKTMQDYHDLYLKSDVCLLADVFESFRRLSLKIYQLDPAHYFTLPGLSFDALLKYTDIHLELLTDIEMYNFFEAGIRGGVASINHRYAEANNKYMGEAYDPTKESSYILYLDCNNLYGYSMSDPLPISDFKWIADEDIAEMARKIFTLSAENEHGYVLEVDLSYPPHLHDLHSSLPLAPEKLSIPFEDLSPYCQSFPQKYVTTPKLIPNLLPKSKYIIHYRNLQLYVKLGMQLEKVHRILEFKQTAWMRPYIELNTRMRQQSTSTFEKNFYKLANNSVYGMY